MKKILAGSLCLVAILACTEERITFSQADAHVRFNYFAKPARQIVPSDVPLDTVEVRTIAQPKVLALPALLATNPLEDPTLVDISATTSEKLAALDVQLLQNDLITPKFQLVFAPGQYADTLWVRVPQDSLSGYVQVRLSGINRPGFSLGFPVSGERSTLVLEINNP